MCKQIGPNILWRSNILHQSVLHSRLADPGRGGLSLGPVRFGQEDMPASISCYTRPAPPPTPQPATVGLCTVDLIQVELRIFWVILLWWPLVWLVAVPNLKPERNHYAGRLFYIIAKKWHVNAANFESGGTGNSYRHERRQTGYTSINFTRLFSNTVYCANHFSDISLLWPISAIK